MIFEIVHQFEGFDGEGPFGGMIKGADGALYGTAAKGGAYDRGVVFRFQPPGSFEVLHNFSGDPDDDTFLNEDDGAFPLAGLIQGLDGTLYGTTSGGGAFNRGCVFKLNPDGSGYRVIHSFRGFRGVSEFGEAEDGAHTFSGVVQDRAGALYGVTHFGGAYDRGIVFKMNPDGSNYQILHAFKGGAEGAYPLYVVWYHGDNALHGATKRGGSWDRGVDFRMNTNGTGFEVLRNRDTVPEVAREWLNTAIVQASDGELYGVKYGGGAPGKGVIYKIMNPVG